MRTMRKIITWLSAVCMLTALIPASAMAAVEGSMEGWAGNKLAIDVMDVNGVTKPVLHWSYGPNGVESGNGSNSNSAITYDVGTLEPGNYQISTLIFVPYNPGSAKFGIQNDSLGGFPDNTQPKTLHTTAGFETISRNITITAEQGGISQKLYFYTDWGDSMYMLISEIAVQKVNTDSTLGENLVSNPNFIKETFSTNYWEITDAYKATVAKSLVNDVRMPVLDIEYKQNPGTTVSTYVGALEAGKYQLSAVVKSPNNCGTQTNRFGITNDSKGDLSMAEAKIPSWTPTFTTITREITVPTSNTKQYVSFFVAWGDDHGHLYIADVSLRRMYDNGTFGENRVVNPNFTVNAIDETQNQRDFTGAKAWQEYGGTFAKTNNYSVRDVTGVDGTKTKALCAYKSSTQTNLTLFGQPVATEANKTYKLSFYAKKMGPALYVGTRMKDTSAGDEWASLKQIGASASDWTLYSFDYTMGATDNPKNYVFFSTEGQLFVDQQMTYFDNVSFCEVINATTQGPNLLTNGDFEAENYKISGLMFDILDQDGVSTTANQGYPSIPTMDLDALGYKMIATVDITNGEAQAFTPTFFVAIYDNGKLYSVDKVEAPIEAGKTAKCTWTLKIPNTVGKGTVSAKAFVWKSASGMTPIGTYCEVLESV